MSHAWIASCKPASSSNVDMLVTKTPQNYMHSLLDVNMPVVWPGAMHAELYR